MLKIFCQLDPLRAYLDIFLEQQFILVISPLNEPSIGLFGLLIPVCLLFDSLLGNLGCVFGIIVFFTIINNGA